MNITLIEPFFTGSHAAWANSYAKHSAHNVEILSLPGNYWKWRMHGGAVTLAQHYLEKDMNTDLLFVTDMLDLTTFLALTRQQTADIPVAIYFHENQMCYPWSPTDRDILHKRDQHYGFINYSSALTADSVLFNSDYHRRVFLEELPRFLKQFPDFNELASVATISGKSQTLRLGLDLEKFDRVPAEKDTNSVDSGIAGIPADPCASKDAGDPMILWNHRWEYDKNPDEFFQALFELNEQGLDFRVALLGETFHRNLPIFGTAREKLRGKIVHYGYAEDFEHYAQWLHRADILPITSIQDFFGASIVEALYCNCYPLLPKRLSYPELLSSVSYSENFYADYDDLVRKLAWSIREIETIRQRTFRHCIERYSWNRMAPEYDKVLANV